MATFYRCAFLALTFSVLGCDSLTDPDHAPTNMLFEGALTWGVCTESAGCEARVEAHNEGPGCARDAYGLFRLLDEDGEIVFSGDWERPGLLWPDERFVIRIDGVPEPIIPRARTYQTQGWWISSECRTA